MKIAHFIGTLKKEDGVALVILDLIKEAQKEGVGSIIVTGWAEDESTSPVPIIQIPSIVFPLYREYKIPLPGIKGFEKKLDEFKPDVIHVHSPETSAWAALKYARKNNIPIIATHHTDFVRYLVYYHLSIFKSFVWFILRRLYKKMDLVTTPSQVVSDELILHGISNIKTIPWGVDFKKFNPTFRSKEWRDTIRGGEEKNIILCVCRLTWEKDLRTLAGVYKLLTENKKSFSMVIAGDGPARKELESMMPGAIFLGHIDGGELSKVFASSDIFLFPSSTETFGRVTLEALASGLVPIVANEGGSKSLITEGENGFLGRSKDVKDFYKKVVLLLDDQKLIKQIQNNCLNFAKNYTWGKVFGDLLEKYTKLLNK